MGRELGEREEGGARGELRGERTGRKEGARVGGETGGGGGDSWRKERWIECGRSRERQRVCKR